MEDLNELRFLIREIIEEEKLEEFSGAGAIAGFSGHLGMSRSKPRRKNKRKMSESVRGSTIGFKKHTYNNHFRYSEIDDSFHDEEVIYYYNGVDSAAKSFGGAENPFGDGKTGEHNVELYLQGKIKYPYGA